jgi:N-acetylneuraminic acid mutarotase
LNSAELYNPTTGIWTATGSLNTARENHTATLLLNGQVLVAGGFTGFASSVQTLNSAELFNPATGIWTPTGNLNSARSLHTATLLPNGEVLVAGSFNFNAGTVSPSAELFNPSTGIWTPTGSLNTARGEQSATLLPNGQVLVAGGTVGPSNNPVTLNSAELFNPSTGIWTPTGSLNFTRSFHTATLLPNGQVLVAGGETNSFQSVNSAEVYNPATGLWSGTVSLNTAREGHTATLLPNGQVVVAGGYSSTSAASVASAELYDYVSTTGSWTSTSSLSSPRVNHTATLLPNGFVLVVGGNTTTTSTSLYNPANGTWTPAGNLNTPRNYHTATLLPNGQVLIAGGYGPSGLLSNAELYNPATFTWTYTGNLNTAREQHTATLLPNGQVLLAGGMGISNQTLNSAELYNPATGSWTYTGNLNTARYSHTATLLPNGQLLVAGGENNSVGYLANAELYNPTTGLWTVTGSLNAARYSHTATLLHNGQVLVAGGQGSGSLFTTSAELYNPATGIWTATGNLNTIRYYHTATLLPNGQVLVAGGLATFGGPGYLTSAELFHPLTGTWTVPGSLNTAREGHTATLLPNSQVLVTGGDASGTSAELYNIGLGYTPATQPQLNTVSSFSSSSALSLTGTNFTGVSEASNGASNNSASNIPVVQLESLTNEQVINVPLDPSQGFSSTSFPSLPPSGLISGYALLTMFVNGTPSISQVVSYSNLLSQTIANFPTTQTLLTTASPVLLTATTSAGMPITYSIVSGPGTINGDTLTLTGTGTIVVLATAAGNSTYAPLSATETITVTAPPIPWVATNGSLNTARRQNTATLLNNGQILVVGGLGSGGILSSAELYNPTTGTWTPTGSLNTARFNHTATLLPNGQVLVAGGQGNSSSPTSAELYNPATGLWTATGSLNIARQSHTATLLPNGQVLVAGGAYSSYLNSAELYNPATGLWTVTGNLNTPRVGHSATLLPNGQVLAAGGIGNGGINLGSSELYNPATGTWTVSGSLNTARYSHSATLLPNGQVLVAGGYNGNYLVSAELYNPSTGTWTTTGNLNTPRYSHTATLLPNGQVLVAGGGGYSFALSDAELFNPATGLWTTTGSLNSPRHGDTATLLPNGLVLAVGGQSNSGGLASGELYNPSTGTWSIGGNLNTARSGHTATLLPNGQVLVAGGDASGTSAELYNPAIGAWTTTGSLTTAQAGHSATLLSNGQVLVAGGFISGSGFLNNAELFNPGLGYTSATQPQLNAVASASSIAALSLTGTNFSGVSEASGGQTNNSASNIPVVQLESLSNEEMISVPLDSSHGFTSTTFTSLPPSGLPGGYTLLTMFVNGTPSTSQVVSYSTTQAPLITSNPPPSTGVVGVAYSFNYTGTGSPAPTFFVTPDTLPPGLTLTSAGLLSGIPTEAGTFSGTVTASNGVSPVSTQTFTITISTSFSSWASQEGLSGANALPTAIVSHDGLTNLLKYSLGLNPFVNYSPGSAGLPAVQLKNVSGVEYLTLSFTGVATDVTYTVQATSTLIGGWSNLYTLSSGAAPGTMTVQDTQTMTASPKRFMRLLVTKP